MARNRASGQTGRLALDFSPAAGGSVRKLSTIRDVEPRFIAPACRHAVRWTMCMNCRREPWPLGLSPQSL